jgi:uncharacterized protein with gpF-like domain
MPLPIARMARAAGVRRSAIPLRPIALPAMLATDLYQAAYADVVARWDAALSRIMESYERTFAQMTTDAPEDTGAIISQVEADLAGVFLTIRPALATWAAKVELAHRRKWAASLLAGAKVDIAMMIGPQDVRRTVAAVIEENVGLVRSVSDETRRRIGGSVFRGYQNRTSPADIAREIREAVAMERRRAIRIAGDQVSKLGAQLNQERRRQAGIPLFRWRHSSKRNPREDHLSRDGNLYSERTDWVGREFDGETVRKSPEDRPGMLPYCGCTEQAVLALDWMIEDESEAA